MIQKNMLISNTVIYLYDDVMFGYYHFSAHSPNSVTAFGAGYLLNDKI